ncbi:MAG: CopG family transcriptional regulator [Thermoproteus sp.]
MGRRLRRPNKEFRVLVSTHLPKDYLEKLDVLVRLGIFKNHSEVAEAALEELIGRYDISIEDEDIDAIRGR